MNQLYTYLKFLAKSKNEHSIHSPFVFNFYNALKKNRATHNSDFIKYNTIRRKLFDNTTQIEVSDFGVGSKSMKQKQRKIYQMARIAGISKHRSKLLYLMLKHLQPSSILEIGTSLGLSTSIMSLALPSSHIVTIEGCASTLSVAQSLFTDHQLHNIESVCGQFDLEIPRKLKDNSYDFVFVDGNHSKQATINYFEMLKDAAQNESCIVFDDIYWSIGMQEAWNHIKNHPKVTVSIDTYQWGIVFFRKEQQKEHFVLRM